MNDPARHDDEEMDAVFRALAHAGRRRMLDIIRQSPGIGVGQLARSFDVSRIAVMKHLALLEAAQLIVSARAGRSRRLYFNAVPIQRIHERWTDEFSRHWSSQLLRVKELAEARPVFARGKDEDDG